MELGFEVMVTGVKFFVTTVQAQGDDMGLPYSIKKIEVEVKLSNDRSTLMDIRGAHSDYSWQALTADCYEEINLMLIAQAYQMREKRMDVLKVIK